MEIPKVICPVCGGEVKEDDYYDYDIYEGVTVKHYIGTCKQCGETIEYDYVYPHLDPIIEIVTHYKD